MSDTLKRIEAAKEKVEEAKKLKIQFEERLERAKKDMDDLLKQMKDAGTTPETIEKDIMALDTELEALLKSIEETLETNKL
jgi:septal ring factor EnvC (AmiA/AmiB activator)